MKAIINPTDETKKVRSWYAPLNGLTVEVEKADVEQEGFYQITKGILAMVESPYIHKRDLTFLEDTTVSASELTI